MGMSESILLTLASPIRLKNPIIDSAIANQICTAQQREAEWRRTIE
jgi:hypothetical protein